MHQGPPSDSWSRASQQNAMPLDVRNCLIMNVSVILHVTVQCQQGVALLVSFPKQYCYVQFSRHNLLILTGLFNRLVTYECWLAGWLLIFIICDVHNSTSTQWTVSEHWKEIKTVTPTKENQHLASFFLALPKDC